MDFGQKLNKLLILYCSRVQTCKCFKIDYADMQIRILGRAPSGVVLLTLECIDWHLPYLRLKVSYMVKEGDQVDCKLSLQQPMDAKPENIPLDIKYEDKHLLVINKPAHMVRV